MKRRGFFGTLAAALAIPAIVNSEPKPKVLKKSYGQQYADAIYQESKRSHSHEATLAIQNGKVFLDPFKRSNLRPGDFIYTDKGDALRIIEPVQSVVDMYGVQLTTYRCDFISGPQKICGKQVMKVAGKYRLIKNCDGLTFKVQFVLAGSLYSEEGVSS